MKLLLQPLYYLQNIKQTCSKNGQIRMRRAENQHFSEQ